MDAQVPAVDPALNFRQECAAYPEAQGKMGLNLACQKRTVRPFERGSQMAQEFRCEKRQIDRHKEIYIRQSNIEGRRDSGKWSSTRPSIGQAVAAYHLDVGCRR